MGISINDTVENWPSLQCFGSGIRFYLQFIDVPDDFGLSRPKPPGTQPKSTMETVRAGLAGFFAVGMFNNFFTCSLSLILLESVIKSPTYRTLLSFTLGGVRQTISI
jgi:hypothetical protein